MCVSIKKIIAIILSALVAFSTMVLNPSAAQFKGYSVTTSNSSPRILSTLTTRWSDTKNSYMYIDGENYVIVNIRNNISVTVYTKDFNVVSEKTLELELPVWGGFYSGTTYNYMVFCQNNTEESTTKDVFRITKYDKNFNKISHTSIIGSQCNTTIPFDAGSVSMAESGNELTVHTARERFTSDDGLNHQSQFTVVLNTETMTPINNLKLFQDNHVSHSFNQFVQYDNGARVLVDHGDAYPRSVVLSKYLGTSYYGYEQYTEINLFEIPGATGANCTGVFVNGFEVSTNNYIVSINTIDHSKVTSYNSFYMEGLDSDCRNAVLLISDKDNTLSENVKKVYLTDYANDEAHAAAPYLIKLSDQWFVAMWMEYDTTTDYYVEDGIRYVIVDENGNKLTDVKKIDGDYYFSDCQPICANNQIIWYYDISATERQICTLDISEELQQLSHSHSLEKVEATPSTCTQQGTIEHYICKLCNKTFKDSAGTVSANEEIFLDLIPHTGGTATCTEKAICSVCQNPYGALKDHIAGDWETVLSATPSAPGKNVKKCTVCDTVLDEEEIEFIACLGDVNSNGEINSSDALLVLQYAVGLIQFDETTFALADVNKNKEITSSDALSILQFAVGLINKL